MGQLLHGQTIPNYKTEKPNFFDFLKIKNSGHKTINTSYS